MDKDRVVGSAKQIKGAVKQVVGKAVGDAKLESEGTADKVEGKVQNAIGSPQRHAQREIGVAAAHCVPGDPGSHACPRKGGNQRWRIMMKKTILLASAAMIGAGFLAVHVSAQGVPQTVEIAKVDVQRVAAGYRASKVIGSSVLNDANETIGKIDDLLVTRDGKEPYAVLSIGGFLGMGTHMVVVRYDSLKFAPDNKIVLPGGSKDGLKMLPAFEYSKE